MLPAGQVGRGDRQRMGWFRTEDPRSFGIQDSLDSGLESVDGSMSLGKRSPWKDCFPQGQELFLMAPTGDLNFKIARSGGFSMTPHHHW